MENQSTFSNATQPEVFRAAKMKIVLYSILLVWSLLGNVLVIAVVYWNTNLRTNFNYLIVNMAVSDLFVPLLALPLKISQEANGPEWLVDGPLGNALCKLCYFLADISPVVSVTSLIIIAVNRFVAVVYPLRGQTFNRKRNTFLISLTWLIGIALFSPYFYTFRIAENNGITVCEHSWLPAFDHEPAQSIFLATLIITIFIIPFFVITMLYAMMLYKIIKNSKHVVDMLNKEQSRFRQKKNKQIFYISIVIVVGFAVLWGPFFCFLFVLQFIWHWEFPIPPDQVKLILFIVQFCGYTNSAINPSIYFLYLQNYKQGLKRLFRRERFTRRDSLSTTRLPARRSTKLTLLADNINDYLSKRRSRTSSV